MRGRSRAIYFILLIALITRLFFIFSNSAGWDSSVYIGMGKYIFSLGKAGLWEASRPLVWPFFLGLIWKIGLNPVIFGKVLTLSFSIGCIYLTYLIGKSVFNEKVGLIASLFLSFSPTFFSNNVSLLTEIPSTFFALLGIYFLIKENTPLSGIFLGISFLTRFFQIFILLALLFLFYFYKKNKNIFKKTIYMYFIFSLILVPYLLLNQLLYKNALYPFSLQLLLTKNTGWPWHEPFNFYFINLFKENFLFLFSIISFLVIISKERDYKKLTIAFIPFTFLFVFSLVLHKEMRLMIPALPFFCLMAAFGLFYSFNKLRYKKLLPFLLLALFVPWSFQTVPMLYIKQPKTQLNEFQLYLKQDLKGAIWVSNPSYSVYSDRKVHLLYYPLFDTKRISELMGQIKEADHILMSTCDIPCPPADLECPLNKDSFVNSIKLEFNLVYDKKTKDCEELIATSALS